MILDMSTPISTAIPTARQLEFQDWELGLFLHFGIRTFYEGYRDMDPRRMEAGAFQPTQLDCDQWIWTAKRAGFRYAVLTAKHHDGFANWPSAYTKFSVASSPWREGKGDVVREFIDACRRHGLAAGLYYSPYDHDHPGYANPKAYDDYFINQISEILGGYGQIDMLWFDGCGSEGHSYDWPRIIGQIRKLQPNVLIFNMADPDYRWVGNEAGVAPMPCWNTVSSVPLSIRTDEHEAVGEPKWLPAECDMRMRLERWFSDDAEMHTVKSVEELMGLYLYSVGRGCNMLVNIGPDRRGLLPENEGDRLVEFGQAIRQRFANAFATLSDFQRQGNAWTLALPSQTLLDQIVLQEELRQGEHVRRFRISALFPHSQEATTIWEGYNIGHKAICPIPLLRVRGVRVEVLEADGPFELTRLDLHGPAR
jgi:alpha-L-fucosidase